MKMLLEFDYKKATQAINYFARKEGGSIDKLKLIKLIYLADRYHLRKYGRPIVNDRYYAMSYGPVCSSVKDIVDCSTFLAKEERQYSIQFVESRQKNRISSSKKIDADVFSDSEKEALRFAYDEFGGMSAAKLVDITHSFPEWNKFAVSLKSKTTTREPMSYLDFFNDGKEEINTKFALGKEHLDATKKLFEEQFELSNYWN